MMLCSRSQRDTIRSRKRARSPSLRSSSPPLLGDTTKASGSATSSSSTLVGVVTRAQSRNGDIRRRLHKCNEDGGADAKVTSLSSPLPLSGDAPSSPKIGSGCFMLTAFTRDRDCLFTLLHVFLPLTDIARLASTCRTWHHWLVHPSAQFLHITKRMRTVSPRALNLLVQCDWARPLFTQIQVNMQVKPVNSDKATLPSIVADLARFPRLECLGLQLTSSDVDRQKWQTTLDALPHLKSLILLMVSPPLGPAILPPLPPVAQLPLIEPLVVQAADNGIGAAAHAAAAVANAAHAVQVHTMVPPPHLGSAIAALFHEIHRLPQLESLAIYNLREAPSTFDFTHLPQLTNLRALTIELQPQSLTPLPPNAEGGGVSMTLVHRRLFLCSPTQAEALGRCRRLQHLYCGVWAPSSASRKPTFVDGVDPDEAALAAKSAAVSLLERSLGALVSGKQKALAEWHEQRDATVRRLKCSAEIDSLPPPSALPLQSLRLTGSVITADAWRHLSQFTQLRELAPAAWAAELESSSTSPRIQQKQVIKHPGWALLANFRQLRALNVAPIPGDENPLRASSFLPPLLRGCCGLQSLHLDSVDLSHTQLQQLIQKLADLRHLSLRALRVESVIPLSEAKRLHTLSLHFCRLGSWPMETTDVSITPSLLDFRRELPAMKRLVHLLIHDRVRITPSVVAPLNAALFSRMPRLKLKNFHQNLLTEPVGAVGPASNAQTNEDVPNHPKPLLPAVEEHPNGGAVPMEI